ncbi:MAG: aryl-sulfate sulfotransferase [Bacteroidota bacterium]|nr:aryl-sulfate sulfotransferase [Bacteroidota bacterium]
MKRLHLMLIFCFALSLSFLNSCKKDENENPNLLSIEALIGNNTGLEITQNPSGIAPLTAIANFESNTQVSISLRILGDNIIAHEFPEMTSAMEIPIFGLYPDTTNLIEITLEAADGKYAIDTIEITTEALPDNLPEITIETSSPGTQESEMILCNLLLADNDSYQQMPIIFDENGVIRWYLDLSNLSTIGAPLKTLENGYLLIGSENYLREYSLLGEIKNEIFQQGYDFHNDGVELPNGNFTACVTKTGSQVEIEQSIYSSQADYFIELNRNTGSMIQEWDMREILDVDRNSNTEAPGDWLQMNGICYSRTDDTYIISGENQAIFKTDRNNDLQWIIAPHQNWGQSGHDGNGILQTTDYLLTAIDNSGTAYSEEVQNGTASGGDFNWTWGQHCIKLLSNGNILSFDNGKNRQYGNASVNFSRAVEYKIYETSMQVEQVWEYGTAEGEALYSENMGDVDILPQTGNRLICFPDIHYQGEDFAKIIEVSYPDNMSLFEIKINYKNTNQGNLTDIIQRAENIRLYGSTAI